MVVDATFGHRIDPSERKAFDEAVAHAELVSPPAGAVGRGDAFLLRVAERVGARVLSNDSFQEFHAEHPWLFDEDRLIGGKPVPGVGWIFTPRNPVRGVRSRAALAGGATKAARAAKAPAATRTRRTRPGAAPRIGDSRPAIDAAVAAAAIDVVAAKTTDKATKSTKAAKAPKATKADKADKATKAAKVEKATKADKAQKAEKTKKAGKTAKADKESKPAKTTKKAKKAAEPETTPAKAAKTAKAARGGKRAAPGGDGRDGAISPTPARSRRGRGSRAAAAPDVRAAIDVATVEAVDPGADARAPEPSRRRPAAAPPAVNDPLTFLTFVSDHPIGSTIEGVVSSFVSHGAMVDVGGMQCYVPLAGLAVPAPRRAREVVDRGEQRQFVLVALDPARRGAELALPEVAARRLGT